MRILIDKLYDLVKLPIHIYNENHEETLARVPKRTIDELPNNPIVLHRLLNQVKRVNTSLHCTQTCHYCASRIDTKQILICGPIASKKKQKIANAIVDMIFWIYQRLYEDQQISPHDLHLLKSTIASIRTDTNYYDLERILQTDEPHHSYTHELSWLNAVFEGEPELAVRCILAPFHGKEGNLGPNEIRSKKNGAIGCITLASRVAIKAGLSAETAYTVADYLINKIELQDNTDKIHEQYLQGIILFAKLVHNLKKTIHKEPRPLVSRIIEEINRNLYKKVQKSDIIKVTGKSLDYAERVFKQDTNMTIIEYLTAERIKIACELLKNSQTKIADIASVLCFSSQSYFGRVFKKCTNYTPEEYRNLEFAKVYSLI